MDTDYVFMNFVDAHLDFSRAAEDLALTLVGLKRGEIGGGAGNDAIRVVAHSNDRDFGNEITIDGLDGDDDDDDEVTSVRSATLDNKLLADNDERRNGALWDRNYDDRLTKAVVDGGEGDDEITARDAVTLRAEGGAGDDEIAGARVDDRLDGGEGDDELEGGAGNGTLLGGAGDGELTGGTGNDRFVFDAAADEDEITDFRAGRGQGDVIEFHGLFADFRKVMEAARQTFSGVVIESGDFSLEIEGLRLSRLAQDDFAFLWPLRKEKGRPFATALSRPGEQSELVGRLVQAGGR